MPEAATYEIGTATWFDLGSPAPEACKRFFGTLFGWASFTIASDLFGDYEVFTLRPGDVLGVAGMQALADEATPPAWTPFFHGADVDATARAVLAAGGMELLPATSASTIGRFGIYADPEGAAFAVWASREGVSQGPTMVDEPGTVWRVELAVRDLGRARRFYGEVFGWRAVERSPVHGWWELDGGRPVADLVRTDERWPAGRDAQWLPYVRVVDCDAVARTAVESGARLQVPPADGEAGRFALVAGPAETPCGVIAPWSPAGAGERGVASRA
ncbi:VOC family protein [Actinomadura sp. WMMB 499]|uniref:VOC family protein n=1 Tax=Actinomadura sp. WMMB 499 TaxID=1219491 RepID=UPI001244728C|nr:VOC family protein [Actinomadura sp. WMMB 499]QFG24302.1 VOC family protein [Actinomadura sp. WMMB 499]